MAIVIEILKWVVPALLGAAVSAITLYRKKLKAVGMGVQCLLRSEIIAQHEKWDARGYCPIYAKEALTRAYKSYHVLGGNDVATALYEETMRLPEELRHNEVE